MDIQRWIGGMSKPGFFFWSRERHSGPRGGLLHFSNSVVLLSHYQTHPTPHVLFNQVSCCVIPSQEHTNLQLHQHDGQEDIKCCLVHTNMASPGQLEQLVLGKDPRRLCPGDGLTPSSVSVSDQSPKQTDTTAQNTPCFTCPSGSQRVLHCHTIISGQRVSHCHTIIGGQRVSRCHTIIGGP